MVLKTKRWDPAEHLDSDEAIVAYVDAVLEDGDPALIAAALGDVARARGMSQDFSRDRTVTRKPLQGAQCGRQSRIEHGGPGHESAGPAADSQLGGIDIKKQQPALI